MLEWRRVRAPDSADYTDSARLCSTSPMTQLRRSRSLLEFSFRSPSSPSTSSTGPTISSERPTPSLVYHGLDRPSTHRTGRPDTHFAVSAVQGWIFKRVELTQESAEAFKGGNFVYIFIYFMEIGVCAICIIGLGDGSLWDQHCPPYRTFHGSFCPRSWVVSRVGLLYMWSGYSTVETTYSGSLVVIRL